MLALWSTMNLVKLSLLLVALAWASPARAQPDVYRGRTINLLVGSGEGGGFDLGARLVAQFLPVSFPAIPPSWCRTCRALQGCGSPNTCPTSRRATAA